MGLDCEGLLQNLEALASIGRAPSGGVRRLALTPEEREAREFVADLLRNAGLAVRTDVVGNVIGRLEGREPSLRAVATGSHVDSVIDGGRFDGVVGVLAAVEAVAAIGRLRQPPRRPLEVIVFMGEESSRFGVGMLGSRAMVGRMTPVDLELADSEGVTLREALRRAGLDPKRAQEAVRGPGDLSGFIELHIEQGPVLEERGVPLGIVDGIAAPTDLRVTVGGVPGHAGTVPMSRRRDALVAAAQMVEAVEQAAADDPLGVGVATVGVLTVSPGVMNVIPGEVTLGVDIRHRDERAKQNLVASIRRSLEGIARSRGVQMSLDVLVDESPVETAPPIRQALVDACMARKAPFLTMHSGAYHDAMSLAAIAPIGMLFIPCREGISHQPGEWAEAEDICLGASVLADALFALADAP